MTRSIVPTAPAAALFPGKIRVPRLSPEWRHAGRMALAAVIALYSAYALQLDSPTSAAVTVVIVSQPVHGMTWSKALYRALGTLSGAAMAILLTAFFAQTPELFLLCFGLWMGLCVAASTLLRNFRSYAAILAGYTVGLIVFPNMPGAPESIFTLAAARISTVLLGIACSAVIGSLLSSRTSEERLTRQLRAAMAGLAGYVRLALVPGALTGQEKRRHALRGDIHALDGLMENAAAEGAGIAGIIDSHRGLVAAMLTSLTAAAAVQDAVTDQPATAERPDEEIGDLICNLRMSLDGLSSALAEPDDPGRAAFAATAELSAFKREVETFLSARPASAGGFPARDFASFRLADRLDSLLDDLILAFGDSADLLRGKAGARRPPPAFHAERRWAVLNGIRAVLTVWLAGTLWILTAWPAGGTMVGATATVMALLSLRDRPDRDALEFAQGVALASVLGLACLLFILPQISDSPLLAPLLWATIFWGALLTANPSRIFMGVGFLIFFLSLLSPVNPMRYDVGQFLNNALAILSGALLTALLYRVVLPIDPLWHVRTLTASIRTEALALAARAQPVGPAIWETRMHDRLIRLAMRLRSAGVTDESLLHGSHAALRMGREILRLRGLLAETGAMPIARETGRAALRALSRAASKPHRAVRICHLAARRLMRAGDGVDNGMSLQLGRAAASLTEIALLLGRHRRFFHSGGARALAGEVWSGSPWEARQNQESGADSEASRLGIGSKKGGRPC